ncbi:methionine aminopeptidase 1-like [Hydractinia symbiolongicarpus]|uniref:methionine aminopeptidase 1-like n=1 Tax=Hydractinia symbiolongicarpus TaxID=13093 RepID=UPI00254EF53A|nr:methionine aminopeptidase 1-like [Hydractinia symbiolongicarpus]
MADTEVGHRICESPGCDKLAKLQCPTCIKLNISGSYFCEQSCFKASWKIHKLIHKKTENTLSNLMQHLNGSSSTNTSPWPGYIYTGSLRPYYPLSPKRHVPEHIARPDYADHPEGYPASEMEVKRSTQIIVHTSEDIEKMRTVCRLARECLDAGAKAVRPGVTTDEIDRIIHEATVERNCYPSPLNYHNFPKSCCTSVNEVICHGIPDQRELQEGDIVNLDVTCYYDGFHGDLNETLFVGKVDDDTKLLVETAYDSLMAAVNEVKPGARYRDMGQYIQKEAHANGCSVTRTYCGHGIHRLFHTAPNVPHYAKNKAVGVMKPGHVFTIEPMINKGTWRDVLWPDDWTAVTQDGQRSAQFEQTLLVTETGVEILTARKENNGRPYFRDQLDGVPL